MDGEQPRIEVPSARVKSLPGGVTAKEARSSEREFTRPTVAIVGGRPLTREGLVGMLESAGRFRVLAVSDHLELLDGDAELRLDGGIILLNLGASPIIEHGVRECITQLIGGIPNAVIIVVSEHEDSHHVDEALRLGVRGFIPTTLTSRVLVEALRLILAGGTYVPAHILTQALADRQKGANSNAEVTIQQLDLNNLTPRQREVLDLLRQGKPNKIIACELAMQESTVKVHVRQIMRKLRATNRTEAAFFASRYP